MAWQAPFSRNTPDWRDRIAPWFWFFGAILLGCALVAGAMYVAA